MWTERSATSTASTRLDSEIEPVDGSIQSLTCHRNGRSSFLGGSRGPTPQELDERDALSREGRVTN